MHTCFLTIAVLSLASGSAMAAAAPRAQPVRMVQLIRMESMPASADEQLEPPSEELHVSEEPGAEPSEPMAHLREAFRLHDLSRKWVSHQMARSFQSQGFESASKEAARAAEAIAPALGIGAASTSAIPVPPWMRGGAFLTPPTRYAPGCASAVYRPSGILRPDAEYRRRGYYFLMADVACKHGIPVELFDAMIMRESRYHAAISSPKNAFGLTQLMPATAAALGVNRYDVVENLRGGARYLRQQLDRFGQYHLALAAYNAGPGRMRERRIPRIPETQEYVSDILRNWSRLTGLVQTSSGRALDDVSSRTSTFGRAVVSTY